MVHYTTYKVITIHPQNMANVAKFLTQNFITRLKARLLPVKLHEDIVHNGHT